MLFLRKTRVPESDFWLLAVEGKHARYLIESEQVAGLVLGESRSRENTPRASSEVLSRFLSKHFRLDTPFGLKQTSKRRVAEVLPAREERQNIRNKRRVADAPQEKKGGSISPAREGGAEASQQEEVCRISPAREGLQKLPSKRRVAEAPPQEKGCRSSQAREDVHFAALPSSLKRLRP